MKRAKTKQTKTAVERTMQDNDRDYYGVCSLVGDILIKTFVLNDNNRSELTKLFEKVLALRTEAIQLGGIKLEKLPE